MSCLSNPKNSLKKYLKTKKINMPKYILDGELDIEPLLSARDFLKKALTEAESELEIAGAIKAFEVCHELA